MSYQDFLTGYVQLQHEVEDEISLCDFPLCNSHAADSYDYPEDFEKRDQEFFEFFTQDFSASVSACPAENIIFCGKDFSKKEPFNSDSSQHPDEITKQNHSRTRTLFKWRSNKSQEQGSCANTSKNANKSDIQLQKATKLAAPIKSDKKYCFTMLGFIKMPIAMQLAEIKTRQIRQNTRRMSGLCESNAEMGTSNRRGGRWLWRLLKVLGVGCRTARTGHANAVVKVTFGCL